MPPMRQNYGGGGGGGSGMSVGMGKEGSALEDFLGAKAAAANVPNSTIPTPKGPTVRDIVPKFKTGSILAAILPTLNISDYAKFAEALEGPALQAAFLKNGAATAPALKRLSGFNPVSVAKTASSLADSIAPTVVQVKKAHQGYQVKMASHHYWAPTERAADRGMIVRAFGEKVALAADETGSVTLGDEGVAEEKSPESEAAIIANFGLYRVKDEAGQELVGFAFPNLLDLDGTALPIVLFTNGSVTALQESIAGELVGKDSGLVFGPQKGHGMFVRQLPNGGVDAMIPMTIKGGYAEGGGQKMHVETYDGRETFVEVQPNIQHPLEQEGCCLVPADFKWMPLGGGETSLAAPEQWGQHKEAQRALASVTARAGGPNSFSLSGFPLEKIAQSERDFLSVDDTLFLLAGLGTDLSYAAEKLAHSLAHHTPAEIRVGRSIKTAGEMRAGATKLAAERLSSLPDLRVNLIKEAAFIPDPLAVDTVLSVGFINPENIMTFVSYLPQIDQTQGKLCELLVAARLGLNDIPTSPLEKAIKSIEQVIEGLKVLAFQKS